MDNCPYAGGKIRQILCLESDLWAVLGALGVLDGGVQGFAHFVRTSFTAAAGALKAMTDVLRTSGFKMNTDGFESKLSPIRIHFKRRPCDRLIALVEIQGFEP